MLFGRGTEEELEAKIDNLQILDNVQESRIAECGEYRCPRGSFVKFLNNLIPWKGYCRFLVPEEIEGLELIGHFTAKSEDNLRKKVVKKGAIAISRPEPTTLYCPSPGCDIETSGYFCFAFKGAS